MADGIWRTPRRVLRLQYFLYFSVLGLYLPYFNLYCYHLGFSGAQIGLLSGLRSAALVIFPFVWGALADRLHRRRGIYLMCNFLACAVWAGFLGTSRFGPMLAISVAHGVFYAPLIGFLEAYAMDLLGKRKPAYGRVRAWGSLGFILIVTLIGKLIDLRGVAVIVPLILAGALLQSMSALGLPPAPAVHRPAAGGQGEGIDRRRAAVFLFCGFLMLVSHGTYYAFFSIHLENLGLPSTFIGVAWAVAVAAEIIVMINSDRIFALLPLETVLLLSFAAAVLRWGLLYSCASPIVVLFSQMLHAGTYGTFHMASILYMDRLSPPQAKTLGQAANNAITYGLGLMVGFLLAGALFAPLGAPRLFLFSAVLALVAGGVFRWGQTAHRPR